MKFPLRDLRNGAPPFGFLTIVNLFSFAILKALDRHLKYTIGRYMPQG